MLECRKGGLISTEIREEIYIFCTYVWRSSDLDSRGLYTEPR
jgi:hypothetical protein